MENKTKKTTPFPNSEINFYNLIWFFMFGSVFGYFFETIWYFIKRGYFVNRQGVIYGPFSQIYGFGFFVLIILLYQFRAKSNTLLFLASGFIGETYEYLSSLFQEKFLNVYSWDYSNYKFNIDGRINLPFFFLWGIVGILIIKLLYPWCCNVTSKIPKKLLKKLSWFVLIFMIFDIGISTMAQHRMVQRKSGIEANSVMDEFLDTHYPDNRLKKIYTSVTLIK